MNWDTNWVPRSLMTSSGRPWSFQIWSRKSWAIPTEFTSDVVGMTCARFERLLSACANALCSDGSARFNEPKSDVTRLQRACVVPSYFYWSLYFGGMFGMCPRTLVPNVDADVSG